MKKIAVLFTLLIAAISLSAQTSRTWTGSTSTDWNTAANWSPSGVPSSSDHIILNTASGNQPLLDANHSITNITVSAGTLNLNSYTLTVTGTTSLTGGNINNGRATFSNSSTTIAGTTFGAIVTITASTVSLSNSTYNSKVIITKTGASSDAAGGNTYNDTLDIRLQNGSLGMATTGNDTYNGDLYFSNTGTGFIALGSSGSFGCTLASGKKVFVGSAGFNSGQLYFRKLTQNGTTPQTITLGGTSTQLFISNTSVFNATLALQAPLLNIGASTFNKKVTLIKTGSTAETHSGGNTFNDTLDIRTQSGGIIMAGSGNDVYNGDVYVSNTGTSFIALGSSGSFGCTLATGKKILIGSAGFNSGQLYLRRFTQSGSTPQSITLGGTTTSFIISNSCVFNGKLTLQAPTFDLGNSTYNNKVIITKTGTSNETHAGGNTFNDTLDIRLQAGGTITAGSGNDAYNGDVSVSNTGSGFLALGSSVSYGCTLATGKKVYIGSAGFNTGILYLRRFTQNGSTAQSITLGGSTTQCIINNATTFNGNFTIEAPNVLIDGSTFNGSLSVNKNGSSSNTWYTANTYNGNVSITNTGTGFINMSNMASGGDVYNGNATFTKSSTGDVIIAGNASTVTFKGDVTLNNISSNQFTSSQAALFTGTAAQTLNQSSSTLNFGRVTINKASNNLTLNAPLTVSTALTLTSGKIITTSTNLLNLADNATVSSASNSSYVQGPMSKTGNDAFTFPTGKAGNYRPIGISAPSSAATVFTTEYVDANQTLGTSADTSIANLSDCEHWTLTRSGSTSNVNVTLAWNSASCNGAIATNMRVAGWNGITWTNYGNGARTGNATAGTVTSNTNPTAYNAFALTNKNCTGVATITPSGATSFCNGGSVTLTAPVGAKKYSWLPSGISQSINASASNSYIVKVADTLGCVGKDTVDVTVWANPTITAGSDTVIIAGDTIQLNATAGSGTSPYSYLWTPSTGLSSTTVANPFTNPDTLTDYIVRVTDANGCVKRDTVRVWAGRLSFTISTDSAYVGDTVIFINTSTGFSQTQLFSFYFGDNCDNNEVLSECTIDVAASDTILKRYSKSHAYIAYLKLKNTLRTTENVPIIIGDDCDRYCLSIVDCNLVCNGFFEDLIGPAFGFHNIETACPWEDAVANIEENGIDLFGANHYHILNDPQSKAVAPLGQFANTFGVDHSAGYAGFFLQDNDLRREYINQELITPLLSGVKYKLSFYVKRSNDGIHFDILPACWLGAPMEVVLSENMGGFNFIGTAPVSALTYNNGTYDFHYNAGTVTSAGPDDDDWIAKSTELVGNGEKYITFGWFANDLTPDIQDPDDCILDNEGVFYYLLDNIIIMPKGIFIQSNDLQYCYGSSPTLSVSENYSDVEWYENDILVETGSEYQILNITSNRTITVKAKVHGCDVEETYEINIGNCCAATVNIIDIDDDEDTDDEDIYYSDAFDYFYDRDTYTLSTGFNRCTFSTNYTVGISGTLVIDGIVHFENANIVMYDDAKILVKAGRTLTITDSWLHGCHNMWAGIEVEPSAKLIIDGSSSNNNCGTLIEDAKLAVHYLGTNPWGGILKVTNSQLQNNYANVKIDPGNLPTTTIYNTDFSANRTLFYPYNAMSTSRSGIDIRSLASSAPNVLIGDNSKGYNSFGNLQWGIKAQNVNLTLDNSRFENIRFATTDDANPTTVNLGNIPYSLSSAVYTWSKGAIKLGAQQAYSLTVGTTTNTSLNNRFNNCENGIIACGQVTPTIKYTAMESITNRGIAVYGPLIYQTGVGTVLNADISNNRIETVSRNGIVVTGIRAAVANIYDNEILNNDIKTGHGIIMTESFPRKNASYRVYDNTIQYVRDGIKMLNISKVPGSTAYYIGRNFVRINSENLGPNTGIGINVENNVKGYIFDNQIVGDDAGESQLKGFNFGMTSETHVTCNDVEDVGHHIFINNNNYPTFMRNNEMNDGLVSIYYNNNAQTGPQGATSANYYWNAWYGEFNYGFTFNLSNANFSSPWVLGAASNTNFNPNNTIWNISNYQLIGTSFPIGFLANTSGSSQPACIDGDPDLEECCEGDNGSRARKFINDTTFVQDTLENRWWSKYRAYETIKGDSLLNISTDTTIANFRNYNDTTNIGRLYTVYTLIAAGELKDASDDNGDLAPANGIEHNLIDFYDWYITKFDNLDGDSISFTPTDTSYIYSLAADCPSTAGPGVYMARALYTYINPGITFFNTCEGGSNNTPRLAPPQNIVVADKNRFSFYPNPAQTIGYLAYNLENADVAMLQLYNILGQPIEQKQLLKENNLIELPLNSYNNGLYLYTVIANGRQIHQGKFIVVKE